MTYIFRKRENTSGSIIFTEKVEQETSSWPSPGAYLRKSTLVTLARNISGFELPPSLVQDTTFDNREEYSGVFECSPVMLTAQEIIDAMSTSIKAARIEERMRGMKGMMLATATKVMIKLCAKAALSIFKKREKIEVYWPVQRFRSILVNCS
jgi:hypothetical protein